MQLYSHQAHAYIIVAQNINYNMFHMSFDHIDFEYIESPIFTRARNGSKNYIILAAILQVFNDSVETCSISATNLSLDNATTDSTMEL